MTRASVHRLAFLLTALVAACPGGDPGTSATGATTTTSGPGGTEGDSTTSQGVPGSGTGAPTGTDSPDVPTGTTGSTTGSTGADTGTTAEATSEPTTAEPESTTSTSTAPDECRYPGPEPNDDEEHATVLPDQGCLSEAEEFSGEVGADGDWYTYHAALACGLEAIHARASLLQPIDVELCLFIACDEGPLELECPDQVLHYGTPNGVLGCCGAPPALDVAFACPGAADHSAQVFLFVKAAGGCIEYSGSTGFLWRG